MNKPEAIIAMVQHGAKIRSSNWRPEETMRYDREAALFLNENGDPHDVNEFGHNEEYHVSKQPKPKVKMWQWVLTHNGSSTPFNTGTFYPDEQSMKKGYPTCNIIQRADWTEIELEEERP